MFLVYIKMCAYLQASWVFLGVKGTSVDEFLYVEDFPRLVMPHRSNKNVQDKVSKFFPQKGISCFYIST